LRVKFRNRECPKPSDFCGLKIWQRPKEGHIYAIGADVAEGVGKDASCAQVIDCNNGQHIASFWSNAVDVDNYASELYKLGLFYNKAMICLEVNNHGHAVAALLGGASGALHYPKLYRRVEMDEYTQKRTKKIGFRTTSQTKPRIIENLKSALRDGDLVTSDKFTILELSNFVRDAKTGRMAASSSARDDRVMSLALAWEQAKILRESIQVTLREEVRVYSPLEETKQDSTQYDPETGFPL